MNENMKDRLQSILDEAMQSIQQSDALDKLNDVRVSFLGKKGKLTSVLKGMKDVAAEERPIVGQMVNDARQTIEQHLEETNGWRKPSGSVRWRKRPSTSRCRPDGPA